MILQERIELMAKLGNYLKANNEEWQEIKLQAYHKNGWFTPHFIQSAADNIADNFLDKDKLSAWAQHYQIYDTITTKNIGIIMAGNIPMVGFHDMLCVFISGHYQTIKLSAKDDLLLKHLVQVLYSWNVEIQNHIGFAEMLKNCDAYIATGSNNSAIVFEEYFSKYPNIIRKNRTSVAILTGKETAKELAALANDIHLYFGLGCRNVTKIYVPAEYDFVALLKSFEPYKYFADHHKYKNNFDYQLSIILLNNIYYMTNDATLLIENTSFFTPVSVVNYEFYSDKNKLIALIDKNDSIQCITGGGFIPFGNTQQPQLFAYADGVDVMQFLLAL